MCSMENAINMDHRQIMSATGIVGCYNPYPIVRVRLISKYRKLMNEKKRRI